MGSAVGVQQHREGRSIVSVRHQHGSPQITVPDHVEGGSGADHRFLGVAGDHMAARQDHHRGALQGGRRNHHHPTPYRRRTHALAAGQHLDGPVQGDPHHLDVQRVAGRQHDDGAVPGDARHVADLHTVRGDGDPVGPVGAVDHQPVRAVPGFHREDGAACQPGGARNEVHPVVVHGTGPLGGGSGGWVHLQHDQDPLVTGLGHHGGPPSDRPGHAGQVLERSVDVPVHVGRGPVQRHHRQADRCVGGTCCRVPDRPGRRRRVHR